ncbi:conserved exported protein of unknown function [Nitrospira sp. KM1]|uniref:hypothetical protein n=1 Tax=Nitrospira sp. KM1 TaxID=1936990 RepID=UPI0013A78FC4|nr:hypothetical protein [Nitrospira sp. KM1]BCA56401.1 conserved exported protein of unknown function [Nitrospira sp. KM1]
MRSIRLTSLSRTVVQSVCTALCLLVVPSFVTAETPAPSVHWGALNYPDQADTLSIGYTGNRFTQFNGDREQFNNISETSGFNFGALSWTQHWKRLEGLSTNVTFGGGPTGEQPTRYLQNEFIHNTIYNIPTVPVLQTRNSFDFMVDASATYWHGVFDSPRVFFIGGGVSSGSLYTEGFGRAGIRRFPLGCALALMWDRCDKSVENIGWFRAFMKGFRLSGMGRFGAIQNGSAFPTGTVNPQSYLAQASLSWGIYDKVDKEPWFEVEAGATMDSGLFANANGSRLEQQFWTVAMRIRNFSLETWNDQLNSQDFGPTYGFRISYNLYPHIFGND